MALLDKCEKFNLPQVAQELGLYPFYTAWRNMAADVCEVDGKSTLMFGGNNYLGLAHDDRVVGAASEAALTYGSSLTGSRLLNGSLELHEELERELADFFGMPAALVFATGYQANLGVMSGLCGPDDVIFFDQYAHASLLDGARLSQSRMRMFRHNSPDSLHTALSSAEPGRKGSRLVVLDGIYSMEGDICALPELVEVARHHQATVLLDDAHGAGVLADGRGTPAHFEGRAEVDLLTLTFSKALASIGGAVFGAPSTISFLRHHARSMVFSAALSPAATAAALTALRIARQEPWRGRTALRNARTLAGELAALGYACAPATTPIIPVTMKDKVQTATVWRGLMNRGVYVNAVLPPAASARLRLSCTATQRREHLDEVVAAFAALR
ncbi:aminotransferase class I/II-fold pyridoxal phosphate-dependent enzyme [Streptomyces tsukubensis]